MNDKYIPLLKCPWCGSDPVVELWHGGYKTKRMVCCDNDDCYVSPQVTGNTRKEALARWNKRAPE